MYHIAHIAPNQEESEVLANFRSVIAWAGRDGVVVHANTITDLKTVLKKHDFNVLFISTKYDPRELLKRLAFLAEFCRATKKVIPLIFELDMDFPLPCILGTRWGGKVGIVHNFSSRSEIMTMLQRCGEVLESSGQKESPVLHSRPRPKLS